LVKQLKDRIDLGIGLDDEKIKMDFGRVCNLPT